MYYLFWTLILLLAGAGSYIMFLNLTPSGQEIMLSVAALVGVAAILWRGAVGLTRHKYEAILLRVSRPRDERGCCLSVLSFYFILVVAFGFIATTSPGLFPVSAVLLLLSLFVFGIARLNSKLEFSEKGIRNFDAFVRWGQISYYSWVGTKNDTLRLRLKQSLFSPPIRRWRIETGEARAADACLYRHLYGESREDNQV